MNLLRKGWLDFFCEDLMQHFVIEIRFLGIFDNGFLLWYAKIQDQSRRILENHQNLFLLANTPCESGITWKILFMNMKYQINRKLFCCSTFVHVGRLFRNAQSPWNIQSWKFFDEDVIESAVALNVFRLGTTQFGFFFKFVMLS